MLGSVIVDVGDCGLWATGVQRIRGCWLVVIIVAVFLKVLLLGLDFVDLFFHLLYFTTHLPVTPAVRTRVACFLVTVRVLLGRLHVMMLDLRLRNLWQMMLFVFIMFKHVSLIVIFFMRFFADTGPVLWHAHVESSGMGTASSDLRLGRVRVRLQSAAHVVPRGGSYLRQARIRRLVSYRCRHRLTHIVSQVPRHHGSFTWGSRGNT